MVEFNLGRSRALLSHGKKLTCEFHKVKRNVNKAKMLDLLFAFDVTAAEKVCRLDEKKCNGENYTMLKSANAHL